MYFFDGHRWNSKITHRPQLPGRLFSLSVKKQEKLSHLILLGFLGMYWCNLLEVRVRPFVLSCFHSVSRLQKDYVPFWNYRIPKYIPCHLSLSFFCVNPTFISEGNGLFVESFIFSEVAWKYQSSFFALRDCKQKSFSNCASASREC